MCGSCLHHELVYPAPTMDPPSAHALHLSHQVLGVEKDATASQIRKGYHKKALKAHPDKASEAGKEKANEIFGALSGA